MIEKGQPFDVLQDNLADAEALLRLRLALTNGDERSRHQRVRSWLRAALRPPLTRGRQPVVLQDSRLLVVERAAGNAERNGVGDLQPLLRQSVQAACAALEIYVVDKAMECLAAAAATGEFPDTGGLSVSGLTDIESSRGGRRRKGVHSVIDYYVQATRGTTSKRIGHILSSVGIPDWASAVDEYRDVPGGTTVAELGEITSCRNRIARGADGNRRRRATIEPQEAPRHLRNALSIAEAIEAVLNAHCTSIGSPPQRAR